MTDNILIKNARGLYAHVVEPHAFKEEDRKKYSIRVLIPLDNPALPRLEAAVDEAKQEFKAKFAKPFPNGKGDVSLRDADYYDEHPEYEGFKVLSASSSEKFAPLVVNEARQKVTDETEFYNGIGISVVVKPYPYNAMGSPGIAFALNGVQISDRSAEVIGGGSLSADALGFEDLSGDGLDELI